MSGGKEKKVRVELTASQIEEMTQHGNIELDVDEKKFGVKKLVVFPVFPGTLKTFEKMKKTVSSSQNVMQSSGLDYIKKMNPTNKPAEAAKVETENRGAPVIEKISTEAVGGMESFLKGQQSHTSGETEETQTTEE